MANSNGWGDGAANNSIGWGQGANNAIAWGDSHAKSWAGATDIVGLTTDPAATAYFASTGIIGATQQTAIDNLVKGLKQDGLWSKMKAVYPFVTDNRNLLSYTEDFGNAYWNKTSASITSNSILAPNGTTTADTYTGNNSNANIYPVAPISVNGNNIFSIYVKSGSLTSFSLSFTSASLAYGGSSIINLTNGTAGAITYYGGASGWTVSVQSVDNGWYRCSIGGNIPTSTGMYPSVAISVGNVYVWGAQLELGSTATTYQPIATTQQAFISNQFKYNLVNPVDSDAAFRLVFNGGWTHSANGATPNGTNGYADTYLNPSLVMSNYNSHLSFYNRSNVSSSGIDVGCIADGGADNYFLQSFSSSLNGARSSIQRNSTNYAIFTPTQKQGYFLGNSTASNSQKIYQSGVLKDTNTITNTNVLPNRKVFISACNFSTILAYSDRQCAFATIGDGLTDTEASNLYTRVQAFQTALSRQV